MVQRKNALRKIGNARPTNRNNSIQIPEVEVSAAASDGREQTLVAGWFSYKNNRATFRDTEAMHVVTSWLD